MINLYRGAVSISTSHKARQLSGAKGVTAEGDKGACRLFSGPSGNTRRTVTVSVEGY